MLKRSLILIALAIMATPAMAQTSFYTDRALQQVNVLTSPTPLTAAIPYGSVRVCSLPLTQQSPCLPLATITDINGNAISNSIGPLFGQLTTDATGRFTFGCTNNVTYQVQVAASASNTPAVNYPVTCPGGVGASVNANNNFTGTNFLININNDLYVCNTNTNDYQTLAAAVAAAPATGGRIYVCPSHTETISTQVTTAKNLTIYVSDGAIFTASSVIGAVPAIKFTGVGKVICGNSSRDTNGNVSNGALFVAGASFTNYLMEFSTATHFSKIQNSMVQGCMFDGNAGTANAIHVSNGFGVTIRDVYILNPIWGVTFENTGGLFTEGSNIDNVYINLLSGSSGCIRHLVNGGTASFDNTKWRRVYCNMGVNNSIAWSTPSGSTMGNSSVEGFKIWFAGTMTGGTGVSFAGSAPGSVVIDLICENQTANAQTCVNSSTATPAPQFVDRGMAGSPIPTNSDGPGFSPSGTRTDNGLVGGAPYLASNNNTPATPMYSFLGGAGFSDAGMYSPGSGNVGWAVAGVRQGFLLNGQWHFEAEVFTTADFALGERASSPCAGAGSSCFFANSSTHMLSANYNNAGFFPMPQTGNTAGTHSDSGFYQTASAAGCTTAASIGGVCATPVTITWPVAFQDANYKVTCQGSGAITNFPIMGSVTARVAANATVQTMALTAAAASFATIECIAVHN